MKDAGRKEIRPYRHQPTFVLSALGYNDDLMYWRRILVELGLLIGDVRILSASNSNEVLADPGVKIVNMGSFRIVYGRRPASYDRILVMPSPALILELVRSRPSVVILNEFTPSSMIGWAYALFFRSVPVLHLCEGDPTNGARRPLGRLKTLLRRTVLRRANHVLTNNIGGRRHLEAIGVGSWKITSTPYISSELPARDRGLRRSGSLDEGLSGVLRVLVTAQVVARKGPVELVEAVRLMSPSLQGAVEIVWVGGGELLDSMQAESACPPCIKFVGPQPYNRMAQWHGWADVMLIPTLHDYRALVGFEALASGLPIVHSVYDGACEEVTAESENGHRYDPRDLRQLGQLLGRLEADRSGLTRMGRCSRSRAAAFTPERCAKNLAVAIEAAVS